MSDPVPHFEITERSPGPMHVNRPAGERGLAGIQTFMKLPVCLTPDDLRAGQLLWAGVDSPWVHNVDSAKFRASIDPIRAMFSTCSGVRGSK